MSFSSETKKELAQVAPDKKCCMLAEIAGFARMNGSIRLIGGGRMSVSLTSEDPATARHFKKLLQAYFDTSTSLDIYQGAAFTKGKKYRITFDDSIVGEQMLREVGLMTVQEGSNVLVEGIPSEIIRKKCCKRAYLRGMFLASGSINHPEKGYHMEIVCKNQYIGADLRKLMNSFDLNAKISERKNTYVVYVKESEKIVDFMNIAGAHQQLLTFEDVRIVKSLRNTTNRINNCENANIDKAVNAAAKQVEDIRLIEERMGLGNLQEKLRVVAELRLENPDLPLKDLAELTDPPVSKSGVNHRLKKLSELAEKIRQEGIVYAKE
ncbi:MAG: DNA-binding protein WhiA [Firmicutes bacterium]|nr:DNA-binding protein WhiA [Bacillota bacterium]